MSNKSAACLELTRGSVIMPDFVPEHNEEFMLLGAIRLQGRANLKTIRFPN
jgi:hypothetical protein